MTRVKRCGILVTRAKMMAKGCSSAPDGSAAVVLPGSKGMDYVVKLHPLVEIRIHRPNELEALAIYLNHSLSG